MFHFTPKFKASSDATVVFCLVMFFIMPMLLSCCCGFFGDRRRRRRRATATMQGSATTAPPTRGYAQTITPSGGLTDFALRQLRRKRYRGGSPPPEQSTPSTWSFFSSSTLSFSLDDCGETSDSGSFTTYSVSLSSPCSSVSSVDGDDNVSECDDDGVVAAGADDETCCICLADFEDGDVLLLLGCGHRYHSDCAEAWLRRQNRCPLCNGTVIDPVAAAVEMVAVRVQG